MTKRIFIVPMMMMIVLACKETKQQKEAIKISHEVLKKNLQELNNSLIEAAKTKKINKIVDIYMDNALLLAEYNPMIDGKEEIRKFYSQIFERQDVVNYSKETVEIFNFEDIVLEIGIFQKSFLNKEEHKGKYFNIWKKNADGGLMLKVESYGYFHPIANPSSLRVASINDQTLGLQARNGRKIPLELQAYNALNENIVRDRDTKKIVETYTQDAIYYPFANTVKSGTQSLLEHYTEYHKNPVIIDSIEGWTYDYDLVKDGVIRYTKFYVEWTIPEFSGKTEGTGISYWKRQSDNSLKIHRQIGLHIHNE